MMVWSHTSIWKVQMRSMCKAELQNPLLYKVHITMCLLILGRLEYEAISVLVDISTL